MGTIGIRNSWGHKPPPTRWSVVWGTGPSGSHPLQLVKRRFRPKARSSSPLDKTLVVTMFWAWLVSLSLLLCIWNYINIRPDECRAELTHITFLISAPYFRLFTVCLNCKYSECVLWGLADCLCGTTYYTHPATEASLYTVQTAWLSLYTLYTTVQINLLTKH